MSLDRTLELPVPTSGPYTSPSQRPLWISHGLFPALAYLLLAAVIFGFHVDLKLAQALFYDPLQHQWLGGGENRWWAQTLLHSGGRDLIRAIVAASLLVWLFSLQGYGRWRHWRRTSAYVLVSMVLTVSIVALLKNLTHVDCPWDLSVFGGTRPYIDLFTARPANLPTGACFPGGHSSSGFALVCFYFVWKDRSAKYARLALGLALLIGTVFAFGQEARGAHFLSHDLTSAFIAWFVALGLYRLMLQRRAA